MSDPSIKHAPNGEMPALGYDPTTTHAMVPLQVSSVVQDPVSLQWYGVLQVAGGAGGTQYTDGAVAPAHPLGTELVFNNAGVMTAVTNTVGLPIAGSITATNPSVSTDGSAIPASSTLIGASDGTNLQQLLVESSSNKNLRVGLYNGANEAKVNADGSLAANINNTGFMNGGDAAAAAGFLEQGVGLYNGTTVDRLRGDNTGAARASIYIKTTTAGDTALAVGQTTMANSLPVALASNQSSVPTLDTNSAAILTQVTNHAVTQGAGAATGTTWRIAGDFTEQAGLSAGALNADLVPSTDVSAFKCFSIQLAGVWNGNITFQCSNDNVNWKPVNLFQCDSGSTITNNTGSTTIYFGGIYFRYLRIRMTSYTSGTATGTLELYTHAIPQGNQLNSVQLNSSNNTIGNVNISGVDVSLISSAAFTTTQTTADQTNVSGHGIKVVLDVTSAGTGSVTLEIDGKDVASGKYYAILTGVAVTANSTNVYTIYPGLTAVANTVVSDVLPHTWRVKITANNANSMTYSVGASLLT